MNVKSFLIFLCVIITFIIVFFVGLLSDVSLITIIKRLIIFVPIMGILGFILGFLFESWGTSILDVSEIEEIGNHLNVSLKDDDDVLLGSNKADSEGKKTDMDPKVAAKAIQKMLLEDKEKS
jgi:hypothetical protein